MGSKAKIAAKNLATEVNDPLAAVKTALVVVAGTATVVGGVAVAKEVSKSKKPTASKTASRPKPRSL